MNAFVAMPFAQEFMPVYVAIKDACLATGITPLRLDELSEPGPIVNQMFREIGAADFVVADVSSKNPNVYYEIGLAHCVRKPTILLVKQDEMHQVPFDVRHQRMITYNLGSIGALSAELKKQLLYLRDHFGPHLSPPPPNDFLSNLSANQQSSKVSFEALVDQIRRDFELIQPELEEKEFCADEQEYVFVVRDKFGDRVVFTVDVNGNIRKQRRLPRG